MDGPLIPTRSAWREEAVVFELGEGLKCSDAKLGLLKYQPLCLGSDKIFYLFGSRQSSPPHPPAPIQQAVLESLAALFD
jgi:hypothetical protein